MNNQSFATQQQQKRTPQGSQLHKPSKDAHLVQGGRLASIVQADNQHAMLGLPPEREHFKPKQAHLRRNKAGWNEEKSLLSKYIMKWRIN